VLRRQALEEELAGTRPPFDPRLDKADELLAEFGRVWALEEDSAKLRRLLATLRERRDSNPRFTPSIRLRTAPSRR
jgi:hypothetical protein